MPAQSTQSTTVDKATLEASLIALEEEYGGDEHNNWFENCRKIIDSLPTEIVDEDGKLITLMSDFEKSTLSFDSSIRSNFLTQLLSAAKRKMDELEEGLRRATGKLQKQPSVLCPDQLNSSNIKELVTNLLKCPTTSDPMMSPRITHDGNMFSETLLPQDLLKATRRNLLLDKVIVACNEYLVSTNAKQLADDLERIFECPICFETMKEPMLALDGHTYEKTEITEWLKDNVTSPMNRVVLYDIRWLWENNQFNLYEQLHKLAKCAAAEALAEAPAPATGLRLWTQVTLWFRQQAKDTGCCGGSAPRRPGNGR